MKVTCPKCAYEHEVTITPDDLMKQLAESSFTGDQVAALLAESFDHAKLLAALDSAQKRRSQKK